MSHSSSPPHSGSLPSRGMWLIALVLAIGAMSLAVAALPGVAKPLFLLPFAFGVGAAALSVVLSRSLALRCTLISWLIATALALGGYGQVVASTYRQFQAGQAASTEEDQKSVIAIQMLRNTEHDDLARQMQADLDERHNLWDQFLTRRYAALGNLSARTAAAALMAEAALVIAGVAMGRRLLDAGRSGCQA